jgi:predicted metalloprotease with PDZ domain
MEGLTRAGWKLAYTDKPTDLFKANEKVRKYVDLTYSLGLMIDADKKAGTLIDVLWNSPAFAAGLAPAMKIVAVNGDAYDADQLKEIVKSSKTDNQPIELLMQNGESFMTVKIDYRDGAKYPRLERVAGTPDLLSAIAAAKK